ncbi:retrotransposon protein [Cucumis melo var. makuwa]|uniref:Retrotransposon protein n=1 Tax=Cucumis melo var. makuwa TaxID=1194695 RepID=A0A5D3BAK7_CUCMM|nr:retrotransposon protein [Cucumis melo var. makuwa]TYJ96872.1 retrotransposon protein [Cucumis melo var. makuwa]
MTSRIASFNRNLYGSMRQYLDINLVLLVVFRLYEELIKKPVSITSNCNDQRWKCFEVDMVQVYWCVRFQYMTLIKAFLFKPENYLGVLDETYIKVNVPTTDQPTFRTHKGEMATNVLGMCDTKENFVYVLAGWEGCAVDLRSLRDVLARDNGLQVPKGYYYLCDVGYPNTKGFLAPYRGQCYHYKSGVVLEMRLKMQRSTSTWSTLQKGM